MGLLAWIIVGVFAGWLAKIAMPGGGPGGIVGNLAIGILGALVGGWIFNYFGQPGPNGLNIGSLVISFIGALVVLGVLRMLSGPKRSRT
jgi:uncharacterized membrane protein YeaQ/YmgE (transglycosylase-associated protein family)